MRTTRELIAELDQEARKFTGIVLAVGFEKTTAFINQTDPNRQAKLDEGVRQGGEPVGFIAYRLADGSAEFSSRVLQEYADEAWAQPYLTSLIELAARALQVTCSKMTEWVN